MSEFLRSDLNFSGRLRDSIAVLVVFAASLPAQIDGRLWLVQSPVLAPVGQVIEVARNGQIMATHPGPNGGSSAVAKHWLLQRTLIADDAGGRILIYQSGVGQVGSVSAPGIRGLAVLASGDVAVLSDPGIFQAGRVQVIPQAWFSNPATPWPPVVTIGFGPRRIAAGRNDTIWVLNGVPSSVIRIQAGVAQSIGLTGVSTNTILDFGVRPDGGLVVAFNQSTVAALVDASGAVTGSMMLPEPPLRIAVDADTSLLMIGASGVVTSLRWQGGAVNFQFPLGPASSFRSLIPDQEHNFWIEHSAPPAIVKYRWQGIVVASTVLPVATSSGGDPLGLEYGTKAEPLADLDNDGVGTGREIHHGSDALDPNDVPAILQVQPTGAGSVAFSLSSPAYPGAPCIILAGLSGNQSFGLGPNAGSAPYLDLTIDLVTGGLVAGDTDLTSLVSGLPLGRLDHSGSAVAALHLASLGLPPGSLAISACAVVVPGFAYWAVTSNGITFTI